MCGGSLGIISPFLPFILWQYLWKNNPLRKVVILYINPMLSAFDLIITGIITIFFTGKNGKIPMPKCLYPIKKESFLSLYISLFFGKRYSFHINLFWRIPRLLECLGVCGARNPGLSEFFTSISRLQSQLSHLTSFYSAVYVQQVAISRSLSVDQVRRRDCVTSSMTSWCCCYSPYIYIVEDRMFIPRRTRADWLHRIMHEFSIYKRRLADLPVYDSRIFARNVARFNMWSLSFFEDKLWSWRKGVNCCVRLSKDMKEAVSRELIVYASGIVGIQYTDVKYMYIISKQGPLFLVRLIL